MNKSSASKVETGSRAQNLGMNNLVDFFNKISLSPEVKEFLSAIGGNMVVTFNPGATTPTIEIVGRNGKTVCSIDEFKKLSMYRRFVIDELKALDKVQASNEKIEIFSYFIRAFTSDGNILPNRIDEGNENRFRQYYAATRIVEKNLETIDGTTKSDAKDYLVKKLGNIIKVYYKLMMECLRTQALDSKALEKELFAHGIPKWLHLKAVDKTFTQNLRIDAETVLFPHGNYHKSICLTTAELKSEKFLALNEFLLVNNSVIVELSRMDYTKALPSVPDVHKDEFQDFLENHMWVLNSPYSTTEILELRIGGKGIPTYRPRKQPVVSGGRPETDIQRIKRECVNLFNQINMSWLDLQNLVVPLENPKDDFWSKFIGGNDAWDITPTRNLYQNLKDFGTDLTIIRKLSSEAFRTLLANTVCISSGLLPGGVLGVMINNLVKNVVEPTFIIGNSVADPGVKDPVDFAKLQKSKPSDDEKVTVKTYLGLDRKVSEKKEKRINKGAVRVYMDALNELKIIEKEPIFDRVKEWISTSFTTGESKILQVTAARYVAGEVLKYKDRIFEEDFDEEEALRNTEEHEEDD